MPAAAGGVEGARRGARKSRRPRVGPLVGTGLCWQRVMGPAGAAGLGVHLGNAVGCLLRARCMVWLRLLLRLPTAGSLCLLCLLFVSALG